MSAQEATLATRDLQPLIGCEITAGTDDLVSGRHATEIRALLEARSVLVFPRANFDDDQQIAFTSSLGTFAYDNNGRPDADGNRTAVYKVSLDPKLNPVGDYFRTSFYWHLDGTMHALPILASVLSARYLPPDGAVTEFCNTYAAYDALSDAEQQQLADLQVVHANWALQRYVNPEPSYDAFRGARNVPAKTQPLVWTHRSGRKSLVIGATAAYVVGLDPPDSMELLVRLRDWATQPRFVYRHEWMLGDVVMWDNTGTLHRARPYSVDSGRLLHRTMLQGEEPIVA